MNQSLWVHLHTLVCIQINMKHKIVAEHEDLLACHEAVTVLAPLIDLAELIHMT